MPDVSSTAPADVRLWVALDVHKHSIVAAALPPAGGTPQVQRIESTERAIRRLIERLGGPEAPRDLGDRQVLRVAVVAGELDGAAALGDAVGTVLGGGHGCSA